MVFVQPCIFVETKEATFFFRNLHFRILFEIEMFVTWKWLLIFLLKIILTTNFWMVVYIFVYGSLQPLNCLMRVHSFHSRCTPRSTCSSVFIYRLGSCSPDKVSSSSPFSAFTESKENTFSCAIDPTHPVQRCVWEKWAADPWASPAAGMQL